MIAPSPSSALIVGYGNTLRGDDGIGPAAAQALATEAAVKGADVVICHQLVPELAERLAAADLAVFIDAVAGLQPGRIVITRLQTASAPDSGLVHHVSPQALLAMSTILYGRSPPAFLVAVGAGSLALGEGLSAPVAAALPEVVAAVCRLVVEHLGEGCAEALRSR
jgi:hydrogenase maturation protease